MVGDSRAIRDQVRVNCDPTMSVTDVQAGSKGAATTSTPPLSALDAVLTTQLLVAWAGEAGDPPRLKWWPTDLTSEFGGQDLFRRLLPHTWRWAMLEGAREAARRRDAELRSQDADPDRLITLFRLGFELDERIDRRFADLKQAGQEPGQALPGIRPMVGGDWSMTDFEGWLARHGDAVVVTAPVGRRLTGEPPASIDLLVEKLVAALQPLAAAYPMPHFRRTA